MIKICSKCNLQKCIDDFHKSKIFKDGLASSCKECESVRSKLKYNRDKTKVLEKCRVYRDNHKNKLKQYQSEYYNANKDRIKQKHRLYWKTYEPNRVNGDIVYKLKKRLRSRLGKVFKRNSKFGSAVRDLGCTGEELKQHLESKFQVGMTWENYGEWHIDHINSLHNFNLTDRTQFLQACHYSNLQPLWALDNIRKR